MGDDPPHKTSVDRTRLRMLAGGLASAAFLLTRPAQAAIQAPRPRSLRLRNLHTGEAASVTYWADGSYLSDGVTNLAHILRDHRNGASHAMDAKLFDLLYGLQAKLGVSSGFHVISGYRSPESNAHLAAASGGVAKHSLHMEGKAMDIRVPGVPLKNVHRAAMSLSAGGVGLYTASDFVHVDTGRLRYW